MALLKFMMYSEMHSKLIAPDQLKLLASNLCTVFEPVFFLFVLIVVLTTHHLPSFLVLCKVDGIQSGSCFSYYPAPVQMQDKNIYRRRLSTEH